MEAVLNREDREKRNAEAASLVNKYSLVSSGTGFIPVPLVDLATNSGVQFWLVKKLAEMYGTEFSQAKFKHITTVLVGSSAPSFFGGFAGSLAKSVPVVGGFLGMVSTPAVFGASTYALGKVFIRHFESGGTFLNFDPEKARAYYEEQLAAASGSGAGTTAEEGEAEAKEADKTTTTAAKAKR